MTARAVRNAGHASARPAANAGTLSVLHVITSLNAGGAERMLERLCRALPSAVQSSVLALRPGGVVASGLRAAGVHVESAEMKTRVPSLSAVMRVRKAARQAAPDIIHGWMPHGNLAALVASQSLGGVPVIWGLRQSLYDLRYESPLTRVLIKVAASLSSRATYCVYNSRQSAAHHQSLGYDASRTQIIPNGFDTTQFAPDPVARKAVRDELEVGDETPVVGMLARHHPMKDHQTAFEAVAELAQRIPDVVVVFAGAGMVESNVTVRTRLDELGIRARVRLLGERSDPPRICAALDVAMLSSYTESFPNAIGEAMSCGVPCVGTDVGATSELIGDTGVVIGARDPGALAAALDRVLKLPRETRLHLGEAARRRIVTSFSLAHVASEYACLYRQAVPRESA